MMSCNNILLHVFIPKLSNVEPPYKFKLYSGECSSIINLNGVMLLFVSFNIFIKANFIYVLFSLFAKS